MRSSDGHRERRKKNIQSLKQKYRHSVKPRKPYSEECDFDFVVGNKPPPKSFPITMDQAPYETDIERFERHARQLGRCILACSLCEEGCTDFKHGNIARDPHFQPSIWHKQIALIKYRPDHDDINGLFKNLDIDLSEFYLTTLIKCPGANSCPYFDIEFKALEPVLPKILIVFDDDSARYFGVSWKTSFQTYENSKILCVDDSNIEKVKKILANPQARNHLLSS